MQRGEQEIRRPWSSTATFRKPVFSWDDSAAPRIEDQEAVQHLEFARRDIPSARLILAIAYALRGTWMLLATDGDYLVHPQRGPARALAWLQAVASRPDPPDGFRLQFASTSKPGQLTTVQSLRFACRTFPRGGGPVCRCPVLA